MTGLRRGELLGLRWDDLDLVSRQLQVRRALQRVDGKLQMVEPLGDAWREHGLVFASSIGTPIEPRNVNRRWDELRRMADLDWLRLHD